jgi:hypothetical protein
MLRQAGKRFRVALAAILVAALAAGCGGAASPRREPVEASRPVAEIIAEKAPEWMALPGVVGVYESVDDEGRPCLKVMVEAVTDELRRKIPATVEGYAVLLRPTGPIGPLGGGR